MKVQIINKHGYAWEFDTMTNARPNIRRDKINNYEMIDGVRVYDEREYEEEVEK